MGLFSTAAAAASVAEDKSSAQYALVLSSALVLVSAVALYLKYATAQKKEEGFDLYAPKQRNGTAAPASRNGPKVTVLFGTQTGTAERFANQLSEEINEKYPHATATASDIETYDHASKLAEEDLALFCVATYGDGEPTDSALSFTEWMEDLVKQGDQDGSSPLAALKYGVFALGNTQYEHFCACGKLVDRQLKALGAKQAIDRGEGDDDANIEDDFQAWKEKLWVELDALAEFAPQQNGKAANGHANGIPVTTIKPAKVAEEYKVADAQEASRIWSFDVTEVGPNSPVEAPISERKELHTAKSERSCIHVEIDISATDLTYETGDHVGVYASNPPELVSEALKRLDYNGKRVVRLTSSPGSKLSKAMFEGKAMSVRDILSNFLDLQSPPRKEALTAMASCASDPKEKARLEHLASKEGRDEYRSHVLDGMRSLLELLHEFPSVKPSLGVFAARIAPKLQPRFYSISSSPLCHPKTIHVTCALVEGKSPTGRHHKGVASTWFSRCKSQSLESLAGDKIAVFVRRSNFKMPKDAARPIVMVGPGTGIAPFRGFLQERQARMAMVKGGETGETGETVLFFGCRRKSEDMIYESELASWLDAGVLTTLDCAFSREQEEKVYVQHKIQERSEEISKLLVEKKGSLYICGDKTMGKDVVRILEEVLTTECVKEMEEQGRLRRDVW